MPNASSASVPDDGLPAPSAEAAAEHGLNADEYARVLKILGRAPNMTELGVFSVMWSEHCSYKSSKVWLKTLPTTAPWVIQGPGENAGVIDIGDGLAAVFKMESHNHPSYIEPYQGAATGVGGILRDVFTMGARPVANLNALRFGAPDHSKTRHLVGGVVAGVGGYGNCVGVPTVGGECEFDASYNGNPLVNAMTVGVARADKIFYSAATGAGNPVVYVGSKTGRDGIHGATMASAEFSKDAEAKRPTVQVGDPFTEKLLIEACMELMATDAIVGIQDMGAAGLTSSSFEMASKGGMGVDMNLDMVPQRETGMTAYEMLLSESQERMLMVLRPGAEAAAQAIFKKWDLDFAVVGELTNTGRMVVRHRGRIAADLPIDPLAAAAPEYNRPHESTPPPPPLGDVAASGDIMDALRALMGSANGCSRRWIWEQYDHMVMADTLAAGRPGRAACALVRVHATQKALAMTSDCTPRYVLADPVEGGRQAVAEAWRNISAAGARPLACTDNMNFGNPERPRIMGQFADACRGMAQACEALAFPIVSGNVSLYNETDGRAILPTPVIGGVGLIEDYTRAVGLAVERAGLDVVLVGGHGTHLGQSAYLRDVGGVDLAAAGGPPPPVNLSAERRTGDAVREAVLAGGIAACQDISSGGMLVALAEMCLAGGDSGGGGNGAGAGGVGAEIALLGDAPAHAQAFGEDQGRYIMAAENGPALVKQLAAAGVEAAVIGKTGGDAITVEGHGAVSLKDLRALHENWLPDYMAGK
ncbi:MAG: phosphoribosylformylglycinamidine synthase subunit PurL [Rhodospirillales bacterium]